jgi:predicted transcriptional regulator
MIDFACKQFNIEEIVKCALGLTKSDLKLLRFLTDNYEKDFTTEQLSKKLKLNLSTIQRSVKKLHKKGTLMRSQHNLKEGGYLYTYKIKDRQKIRKIILEIMQNWVKNVEEGLNKW